MLYSSPSRRNSHSTVPSTPQRRISVQNTGASDAWSPSSSPRSSLSSASPSSHFTGRTSNPSTPLPVRNKTTAPLEVETTPSSSCTRSTSPAGSYSSSPPSSHSISSREQSRRRSQPIDRHDHRQSSVKNRRDENDDETYDDSKLTPPPLPCWWRPLSPSALNASLCNPEKTMNTNFLAQLEPRELSALLALSRWAAANKELVMNQWGNKHYRGIRRRPPQAIKPDKDGHFNWKHFLRPRKVVHWDEEVEEAAAQLGIDLNDASDFGTKRRIKFPGEGLLPDDQVQEVLEYELEGREVILSKIVHWKGLEAGESAETQSVGNDA